MINNYMIPEKDMNTINNINNRDKDKEIITKNQRSFFLLPNQQHIQHHNIIFENHPIQTRLDTRSNSLPNNDLKNIPFTNSSQGNSSNYYSNNSFLTNNSFLNDINSINTRQNSNKDINNISYIPNPAVSFQPINQQNNLLNGDKIIPHTTRNN